MSSRERRKKAQQRVYNRFVANHTIIPLKKCHTQWCVRRTCVPIGSVFKISDASVATCELARAHSQIHLKCRKSDTDNVLWLSRGANFLFRSIGIESGTLYWRLAFLRILMRVCLRSITAFRFSFLRLFYFHWSTKTRTFADKVSTLWKLIHYFLFEHVATMRWNEINASTRSLRSKFITKCSMSMQLVLLEQ